MVLLLVFHCWEWLRLFERFSFYFSSLLRMEMTISISDSVFFSHFFFSFSSFYLQMKRCLSSDLIQPMCTLCFSFILLPLGHFNPKTSLECITTVMPFPLVFSSYFLAFLQEKKNKLEEFLNVFCTFSIPTSSPATYCLAFFHLSYLFQSPKPPLQRVTNDLSPLDFLTLSPVSP